MDIINVIFYFSAGTFAITLIIKVISMLPDRKPRKDNTPVVSDVPDEYMSTALMNAPERYLLDVLDFAVLDICGEQGVRVFSQVSYSAFLKASSRNAFLNINQKRAGFVICDSKGVILCVLEYHGSGHFGRTDASRQNVLKNDAMKRKALKSADVNLIEVPEEFTRESIQDALIGILPAKA